MPTSNPRINVTLSVSLDRLVGQMATHTRVSKSQVLRELLEAAEPALQRAVALMDAGAKASAAVKLNISGQLQKGQDEAEEALRTIMARLDGATGDLVSMAEAVQGKRPARREALRRSRLAPSAPVRGPKPGDPPASNRGVKSPPNGKNRGKSAGVRKVRGSA
jgi:hypothetical protein